LKKHIGNAQQDAQCNLMIELTIFIDETVYSLLTLLTFNVRDLMLSGRKWTTKKTMQNIFIQQECICSHAARGSPYNAKCLKLLEFCRTGIKGTFLYSNS